MAGRRVEPADSCGPGLMTEEEMTAKTHATEEAVPVVAYAAEPPISQVVASLRRRYFGGAFWSIAGTVAGQGFTLIAAVVVARLLGAKQYGELGILMRTTAAFGTFAGMGLGTAVNRYLAELRVMDPVRAGRVWGMIDNVAVVTSLCSSVLVLVLSPYLSENVLKAPHLHGLLCLSIVALVFNTLTGIQNAALAGFEAFRKTALVNVIRGMVNLPAMVVATYAFGLTGAVAGLGVVSLAAFGVGRVALHQEAHKHGVPLRRKGTWSERSVLWRFSLPIFASGCILITGEWFCEATLARSPGGYVQMGLYLAAFQWTNAIEFLQNTLASPAISLMSNLYWTNDLARFRKLCLANLALVAGAAAGVAAVIAALAPWIIGAYGEDFESAVVVLRCVCFMGVVQAVSRSTSGVLHAVNRVRVEWMCSMVRISLQLLLFYLLIDRGAVGLVLAMAGAYVAQLTLQGVFVGRLLYASHAGGRGAPDAESPHPGSVQIVDNDPWRE